MNSIHKSIYGLLLLFGCTQGVYAQERLTLEDAIGTALKNNYDIKLSNNDVRVSKNNIKAAKGGMLPVVTGNFLANESNQHTRQVQSNGNDQTISGARSTNLNYGAALNWKVFDGFQMFANYDRMKELQKLGETNAKLTVQTTVTNVLSTYFDLVKQEKELTAANTAIEISRLRLNTVSNKYHIGKSSKLDVLAAKVDFNADTTSLLQKRDLLNNTKVKLNQIMARDLNIPFSVSDTIVIDRGLMLDQLLAQAEQQNPNLQTATINKKVAELNLKQVRGNRYPSVSLNTGYNFNNSTSQTGFARELHGRGLTYGVTASLNIFSGFVQQQNENNAKIAIESSTLNLSKLKQDINAQLISAYQSYKTYIELVRLEGNNLDIARQNMDITYEKYRLGSISALDLREAQRNFLDASTRYINAQYQAKLSEIGLKEITGTIGLNQP